MKEKLIEWLIRTLDVTVIDLESKILIDFYQINKVVVIDWEEVEKIEGFFAKKIYINYEICEVVFKTQLSALR